MHATFMQQTIVYTNENNALRSYSIGIASFKLFLCIATSGIYIYRLNMAMHY